MRKVELHSKRMECYGLVLILASTFFQLFLSEPAKGHAQSSVTFKIEEKLDVIYQLSKANYQKMHYQNSNDAYNPRLDSKLFYKFAEMNKNQVAVKTDSDYIQIVVGLIFLLGSALICIGKYSEYNALKCKK